MNTISINRTRMALLLLTSWIISSSLMAQEKIAAQPNCQSDVRPIMRAKPAAMPVSVDWTTLPSTYSHDDSGQRVDQYVPPVSPETAERPDFVRSGFRHSRSSLQTGFSADHYHVTEQWGRPVQPYGEWRYPNRPFSVPYGQWGRQLPQVVGGGLPWRAGPVGPWNANGGQGQMVPGQMPAGQFGPGQFGQGQFGQGTGAFGVGPNNVLPASQDEYYQQAPFFSVPETTNIVP